MFLLIMNILVAELVKKWYLKYEISNRRGNQISPQIKIIFYFTPVYSRARKRKYKKKKEKIIF